MAVDGKAVKVKAGNMSSTTDNATSRVAAMINGNGTQTVKHTSGLSGGGCKGCGKW